MIFQPAARKLPSGFCQKEQAQLELGLNKAASAIRAPAKAPKESE